MGENVFRFINFKAKANCIECLELVGWLVVLGLTVYIGPSPREREKEKRNDRRE